MSTRIGCDNLVYAIQTTEDTASALPVYGMPISAPGVISVGVNPNSSQETLFADDGPMETATTLGKIEVEIQKNELTTRNKADLLGHKIDTNGSLVYGDSDVPPNVAIAFRTLKSNGKYRYTWLYKGKFTDPEDTNETKGDSISFQTDTINGQFVKLSKSFAVDGASVRPWKIDLDADYEAASEAAMQTWFDAVKMPNGVTALAGTLTLLFSEGLASGSTSAVITETAGVSNHFVYVVTPTVVETPALNTVISAGTTYTSGGGIASVVLGESVSIYEVDADNKAIKFATHVLVSTEITA